MTRRTPSTCIATAAWKCCSARFREHWDFGPAHKPPSGLLVIAIDEKCPFARGGVVEGSVIATVAGKPVGDIVQLQRIVNDTPPRSCLRRRVFENFRADRCRCRNRRIQLPCPIRTGDILDEAIAPKTARSCFPLPSAGLLRHCKSRFVSDRPNEGVWVEADAAEHSLQFRRIGSERGQRRHLV